MNTFPAYVPKVGMNDLWPLLILCLGGVLALIVDALTDKHASRRWLPAVAFASIALTLVCFTIDVLPLNTPFFEGMLRADQFGTLGCLTILLAMLAMTAMGPSTVRDRNLPSGEFYSLLLFATFGMVTLALANELVTAFIAIEILSLSLYVLTGIDRRSARSSEASFKYFILGAFASAFYVMGMAFLFGATGTTQLHEMAAIFEAGQRPLVNGAFEPLNVIWVYLGFTLLFVGLCFKLSLAPFHMWAPDVYEGAPTAVTMAIATASKIGAFALLFHVLTALGNWPAFYTQVKFILSLVAVLSMLWGNLAALVQTNVKRMLAYSSIAHGGYMMLGFVALLSLPATETGLKLSESQAEISESILLYLFGYTLMNVLAFGIAHLLGKGGEGDMKAYRGLWKRSPIAAAGMALAMFSLVGMPPTVGFIGKFFLFRHAIEQGLIALATIGVLASVISAFYYLRLIVTMFMTDEEEGQPTLAIVGGSTSAISGRALILSLAAALIFAVGIMPMLFFAFGRL